MRQPKKKPPNDLDILFPDIEITMAGKKFYMRELRFAQQLQYNHLIQPIACELDDLCWEKIEVEDIPDALLSRVCNQGDNLTQLISVCCSQPVTWINSLSPSDGEDLILYWWSVNQAFFIRRWKRKEDVKAEKARIMAMAGQTSSNP